ncbi:hypothetical protein DFQ26_001337 [Actinomortierella ambigua]|nr:hypothetical protein DFQ26_001337 [Actinomortierella ambigua]
MASNVLLIGNTGVGKSYLLNSIGGTFMSGFSTVDGLTTMYSYQNVTIDSMTVRLIDTPGLLEATDENVARNAKVITDALHTKGGFKLIFVLAECGGRVSPSDLFTIGKVLYAIDFAIDVGLIINKVHEDDLGLYKDGPVRDDMLKKLNSVAEGKIKSSWFMAIPLFRRDNPSGPRPLMTALLADMTSQTIPHVKKVETNSKEFSHFSEPEITIKAIIYEHDLAVDPRGEEPQHSYQEVLAQNTTNVLLVGNSGVGKSYLLNSIGGNFESGFNTVEGLTTTCSYCDVTIGTTAVRLMDVPGLLEATDENVARNAKAITDALNMKGGFKMVIVLPESGGRLLPSDLFMIGKVLSAIGFSIDVGLIINKVHEDELELYENGSVRNDLLTKLNMLAEGKIKSSWFVAIPRFSRDNPKGPQPLMTELLSNMISQDIPKVNPVKASVKEFNSFVAFMVSVGDFFVGMWRKFQALFKK